MLSSGYELGLRLPEKEGTGDVSRFFVYDKYGNEDEDIVKYLHSILLPWVPGKHIFL